MGWAFGLGLDRIAMVLFGIPDIRLFWSQDTRFASQFQPGQLSTFQPYSRYPACFKDISFWAPEGFHENIFCDIVRDVAGDLVSDVQLVSPSMCAVLKKTILMTPVPFFIRLTTLCIQKPKEKASAIASTTSLWTEIC